MCIKNSLDENKKRILLERKEKSRSNCLKFYTGQWNEQRKHWNKNNFEKHCSGIDWTKWINVERKLRGKFKRKIKRKNESIVEERLDMAV